MDKFVKSRWYLYILECSDKSLYTGITNDLAGRFAEHKKGNGAKYTRRGVRKIVYTEAFKSMSAALKREYAIKKLPRKKKLELI